jgi:hypothetical protein
MLKLSSVAEHKANPPIMGMRERFTYIPVFSPTFETKNRNLNYINRLGMEKCLTCENG